MFKKIYLTLILAGLALAQTNFEAATKRYLIDVSDKKAVALYEKSCREDKNAAGCYMAAAMKATEAYDPDNGELQGEIFAEALELYKASCDMGYAQGCAGAGEFYDPASLKGEFAPDEADEAKSDEFYEKACENGSGEACMKIAKQRDNAAKFADALKYYSLACDAGEAQGCYNAADIYESGDGMPKDKAAAAKFYGLACENGLGRACAKFEKLGK